MSNTRIKDLSSSASLPANDDYLVIDGDTNGTRKIKPADLKTGNELTSDIRDALLQIAEKVAYIDDQGQSYYDDLYNALYYIPPATLLSISAVYTQTGDVNVADSLDVLKADLVVTALYDDASTEYITNYTLSGTLTKGTSTITVTYKEKTDTFDVTVSADLRGTYNAASFSQAGGVLNYYTNNTNRLIFAATTVDGGKNSIGKGAGTTNITCYPILVPESATQVKFTLPSDVGIGSYCVIYNGSSNWEVLDYQTWTYGEGTYNIASYEGQRYVAFSIRNSNNDATITTADRSSWVLEWA